MPKIFCRPPPGVVLKDQQLPKSDGGFHPHLFDIYIPNGVVNFVAVGLHGGSGGKQYFPQALGVTTSEAGGSRDVRWSMLERLQTALIVPQGQYCDGTVGPFNPGGVNTVSAANPDGVRTWSNHFMWSGADDLSMLKDMALWIVSTFGNVVRVLLGHSNGGMMTHRVWMEAPGYYNYYASICGPMPIYYDQSPIPTPSQLKPMLVRYSLKDDVVGVYGGTMGSGSHFWDLTWWQASPQLSVADVDFPNLGKWISGWRSFAHQVSLIGREFDQGNYSRTEEAIGYTDRWDYSSSQGVVTMSVMSEGSHKLVDQTKATRRWVFWDVMLWAITKFTGSDIGT